MVGHIDGNSNKESLWNILTKTGLSNYSSRQFDFASNMPFRRLNQPDTNDVSVLMTRFTRLGEDIDSDNEYMGVVIAVNNSMSDGSDGSDQSDKSDNILVDHEK